MPKQIVIAEQHRIAAVFSEDQIQELIVATGSHQVSDIYLGIVENVLPGIDAAFVNIGDSERNGFIHVSDLGPLRLKRSAGSITELLAPQQKVLVQVMKEPTGNKGPRLTGNISMPGRYLVLMPYGRGVNLSRRIRNENERNRLRALAILIKPAGMGIVIRTEAEGMPEEAIMEDLEALQRQWEAILQEAGSTRAPALLNRDDDFIQKVLRDVYSSDVNRIVVDSHTGLKRVKQQLLNWGGGKSPQGILTEHHRDRISILDYFRVNAAIREALKPRVDLPSGGYIIIERTEALTVIDVNSGSFTRSATARETVLWTNCEAATEIARQLRLRNIAGVIIVDFIDMESRRDQLQVLEHFNKALRSDKAKPQISQLSELGLVELTRKRQGKNIYELFGRPCPTCGGLGHVVHLPGETEPEEGSESLDSRPAARYESTPRRAEPRRDLTPSPAAEAFWEGDDLEGEAGENDLELLHHPSYQERGRSARNRRQRRPRIGEEAPRAEFPRSDAPVREAPPRPSRWEESGTRPNGSTPAPTLVNRSLPEFAPEPAIDAAPVEEAPRENRYEDRRNNRNQRRDRFNKTPAEPPEVVYVEMTPDEQDVYAWMGISPLILSGQEVKNPKSAIVSILLPGEAPPPEAAQSAPTEELTTIDVSSLEEPVEVPVEADFPELAAPEIVAAVETPEPEAASAEEPEEEAPVRRRRRRSSATAGE
ncbi:Rne/Rng family ribonuclease [Leptolyngbya sp. NIES-2104]|uniref:Rne/Rng family ribonuclease n=1 Tax=Leptolyngbya sp. NIES-2104 TaxID=1552121 RepID=UPI0006ECBBF9|nr:Rne/Rng family ribonuclease [Leptolyngbya sp. NIES-2104]GAP97788.1 ribonuclease E [Leptolyngbya sp. NIES-2104]